MGLKRTDGKWRDNGWTELFLFSDCSVIFLSVHIRPCFIDLETSLREGDDPDSRVLIETLAEANMSHLCSQESEREMCVGLGDTQCSL